MFDTEGGCSVLCFTDWSWLWGISDVFHEASVCAESQHHKVEESAVASVFIGTNEAYLLHSFMSYTQKGRTSGAFHTSLPWLQILHRQGTKCTPYKSVIIERVCHPDWADPSLNTSAHFRDLRVQRGSVWANMSAVRNVRLTYSRCAICGLDGKIENCHTTWMLKYEVFLFISPDS